MPTCRSGLLRGPYMPERIAMMKQCWGESVKWPGASSLLSVTVCLWRLQRGSRPVIAPRAQPPAERPGLEWLIHWLAALPPPVTLSSFPAFSVDFCTLPRSSHLQPFFTAAILCSWFSSVLYFTWKWASFFQTIASKCYVTFNASLFNRFRLESGECKMS